MAEERKAANHLKINHSGHILVTVQQLRTCFSKIAHIVVAEKEILKLKLLLTPME